jgi:hypothetical protein
MKSTWDAFLSAPTLLWFTGCSDWMLQAISVLGMVLAAIPAIFGSANMILLSTLWILYHSYVQLCDALWRYRSPWCGLPSLQFEHCWTELVQLWLGVTVVGNGLLGNLDCTCSDAAPVAKTHARAFADYFLFSVVAVSHHAGGGTRAVIPVL